LVEQTRVYEYNRGTARSSTMVTGSTWAAQVFITEVETHTLYSIRIKAYRILTPGTLTVSIRSAEPGGEPAGADLTSGTINSNNFTTDTDGLWYEVIMSPTLRINKNQYYAIVIRAADAGLEELHLKDTNNSYEKFFFSDDSGSNWTEISGVFMLFEEMALVNIQKYRQHQKFIKDFKFKTDTG